MSMQGTLVKRGSNMYVLYETTFDSSPELHRLWWRVVQIRFGSLGGPPQVGDAVSWSGEGWWGVTSRSGGGAVFTGPGNTEAEHREIVSVPPPKVRKGIELRWYRGRWEKLLKTGWAPAGMGKVPPPGGKRRQRRGGKRRAAPSGAALIKAAKALKAAWR